ncbi:sugar kinase [Kribbella sp. ALI-6-A]|uniref:PfkB family carbohydrate kinase n=1 Tax=Kribbella sp. ALI-6-A TaxID=1933817 RepID=UPI00097C1628|nr:PfkB family carbohydrate kinase [Kribbella sp. ALI-6-A]ONI68581.1 sugar kinase [Kribbella sp. ALI-6-A]
MRLVHLGNVVVDLVLTVDELPERGGDALAGSTDRATGGGFNVMAAASRLGLETSYYGVLGTGPFADQARVDLHREGIDFPQPQRPELDTGFVVVLVDSGGERTFVTSPGAEATLSDVPETDEGDLVYVSGYSLLHAVNRETLVRRLPELAGTVFFDPGPLVGQIPAEALDVALSRADWVSCNAREAAVLGGGPAAPRGVIVRLGPDGCRVGDELVPGFAVEAVDLNGAGDAHSGAFLASLAAGLEPLEAARRANAAAAIAVTRRGPATGPTRAELDAFLRDSGGA